MTISPSSGCWIFSSTLEDTLEVTFSILIKCDICGREADIRSCSQIFVRDKQIFLCEECTVKMLGKLITVVDL